MDWIKWRRLDKLFEGGLLLNCCPTLWDLGLGDIGGKRILDRLGITDDTDSYDIVLHLIRDTKTLWQYGKPVYRVADFLYIKLRFSTQLRIKLDDGVGMTMKITCLWRFHFTIFCL